METLDRTLLEAATQKVIYILETKFAFHKQETCLEAFIDQDCYIWRISRNESNGLIDVIVYILKLGTAKVPFGLLGMERFAP
jgi:hypothetical protein